MLSAVCDCGISYLYSLFLQALSHKGLRVHGSISCNLDVKVKVKGKKGLFAKVYHRLQSSCVLR